MKVLIDNGHGNNTPGKRSPDGRLLEWAYTREIADSVVARLQSAGIDSLRIVTEDTDISLEERVRRANAAYAESGKQAILVSIHCNAAGNGSAWMNAGGWSVFVDPTASAGSKRLATALADAAATKKVKVRTEAADHNYWTSSLYICKHTNCPAVLVENFFQDNKQDVDFLLSEAGKQCVTDITVEGVLAYLNQ